MLDPTQLKETTDCPRCHASKTFRPKGVVGQYWINRCSQCRYSKDWPLPKITKKIVYLDQFVISNFVKVKHPFWIELHKKLSSLVALQVIVCPYSEVHKDESLLSKELRDRLKEMYRSFGGDDRLRRIHDIRQDQLLRSIRTWLGVPESDKDKTRAAWRDAFDSDPHTWTGDLQIYAEFPVHEPWVDDLRERKDGTHEDLKSVCEFWKSHPATFDQDVAEEVRGFARQSIEVYRSFAHGSFNPRNPPSVHPGVTLIHWLAVEVKNARPEELDPVSVVQQFFDSAGARQTPFLEISSSLWAKIAQYVRQPKGSRLPDDGDSFDINAISMFAPYCDAMFIEKEFEEMWRQLKLNEKYSVRLFSMRTKDEFASYLDDILKSISDAHLEGLTLVYPEYGPMFAQIARNRKNQ